MTLSFRYLALMILLNSLLTGCAYNAPNPIVYKSGKDLAGNNKLSPKRLEKPEDAKKKMGSKGKVINKIRQPVQKGQGVKPKIEQTSKVLVVEITPNPPKTEPPAEIPASIDP